MNWNPCIFYSLECLMCEIALPILCFMYVGVGRWIALISWKIWTVEGNNKTLAYLFFPHAIKYGVDDFQVWDESSLRFQTRGIVGMPTLITAYIRNEHSYEFKVLYFIFVIVCWPLKMFLNIGNILIREFLINFIIQKKVVELFFWIFPKDIL
jgi:hypothetical protein